VSPTARRFFGCLLPATLALGACLSCTLLAYASQAFAVRRAVTTAEMAPELSPGVNVWVDNAAFWAREPRRGEIVWMQSPDGRTFRRVLGIPGDQVVVQDGRVRVNGVTVDESYATGTGDEASVTLEPDQYFVLADDRNASDSRTWGPTPRQDIFGAAAFTQTDDGFQPIRRAAMPPVLEP
jgi:signal peptidase I